MYRFTVFFLRHIRRLVGVEPVLVPFKVIFVDIIKSPMSLFPGGGENQSDRGGGCGLQGGWALSGGGVQ